MTQSEKFIKNMKPGQLQATMQLSSYYVDAAYRMVKAGIPAIPYCGLITSPTVVSPSMSFDLIVGVV